MFTLSHSTSSRPTFARLFASSFFCPLYDDSTPICRGFTPICVRYCTSRTVYTASSRFRYDEPSLLVSSRPTTRMNCTGRSGLL